MSLIVGNQGATSFRETAIVNEIANVMNSIDTKHTGSKSRPHPRAIEDVLEYRIIYSVSLLNSDNRKTIIPIICIIALIHDHHHVTVKELVRIGYHGSKCHFITAHWLNLEKNDKVTYDIA